MKAIRALYIGASVLLTVHGVFHVWQDLMLIPSSDNPLEFLFGAGQFGLMVHIIEWPILFTALAIGYLREGDDRRVTDAVRSGVASEGTGTNEGIPHEMLTSGRVGSHPIVSDPWLDSLDFGGGESEGTG